MVSPDFKASARAGAAGAATVMTMATKCNCVEVLPVVSQSNGDSTNPKGSTPKGSTRQKQKQKQK